MVHITADTQIPEELILDNPESDDAPECCFCSRPVAKGATVGGTSVHYACYFSEHPDFELQDGPGAACPVCYDSDAPQHEQHFVRWYTGEAYGCSMCGHVYDTDAPVDVLRRGATEIEVMSIEEPEPYMIDVTDGEPEPEASTGIMQIDLTEDN